MKRKCIIIFLAVTSLLVLHTYIPNYIARKFISGISSADPKRINGLMPSDVSFKHDSNIPDWYSFYLNDKLVIGPFPLQNYTQDITLNLRVENPTFDDWLLGRRSIRVFGTNYPKQFIISYTGIRYKQGIDPRGQAG